MNYLFNTLISRRSTKVKYLAKPGPKSHELESILTIAARVPDHGKLSPFYFVIFEGDARQKFGKSLRTIWERDNPNEHEDRYVIEEERLLQAPLVIAVISRIRTGKIPVWEQLLTAGAACYNLCLAANSLGYGSNWLTEWYSYHPEVHKLLGLEKDRDHIAGFVYIGTAAETMEDRARPDLNELVNHWDENQKPVNNGDVYNKTNYGLPKRGFKFYE